MQNYFFKNPEEARYNSTKYQAQTKYKRSNHDNTHQKFPRNRKNAYCW